MSQEQQQPGRNPFALETHINDQTEKTSYDHGHKGTVYKKFGKTIAVLILPNRINGFKYQVVTPPVEFDTEDSALDFLRGVLRVPG